MRIKAFDLPCELRGAKAQQTSGRLLTAPQMNAGNSFNQPDAVKPIGFNGFKVTENGFVTTLPARSVVVLEIG